MASSISLPDSVVLKSEYNGKYLEYVKEGHLKGYVRFSGEDVRSPLSKFQVERAESNPNLVHLRCCYNNKYLVASAPTQGQRWLVSEADKPEEDRSKWTCTLFMRSPGGVAEGEYVFTHLNTGFWPRLMDTGDDNPKNDCLLVSSASSDELVQETFTVIDWSLLVVLPQYVAFKGDNGNYLGGVYIPPRPEFPMLPNASWFEHYLVFETSDSGAAKVAHEVFPNPDGSIRLKSTYYGQFWRRSPNWIWPDSDYTGTDNKETNFWPVKVDDNTIALRSMANDKYCQRLDADGKVALNAAASSISKEARLQVTDLTLSKDIRNVRYHLARARTYNEHVTVMGTGVAFNTTDRENSMNVKVARTETKSSSWNSSVSFKLGVKTTLVTKVPFVAEGKIEISAELTTAYQWGEVHAETNTIESMYQTFVPPMTKATVYAVVSTATCDVPYSYTQTDTLMDGTKRTYDMDDGIYTGINSYKVTYKTEQEKI